MSWTLPGSVHGLEHSTACAETSLGGLDESLRTRVHPSTRFVRVPIAAVVHSLCQKIPDHRTHLLRLYDPQNSTAWQPCFAFFCLFFRISTRRSMDREWRGHLEERAQWESTIRRADTACRIPNQVDRPTVSSNSLYAVDSTVHHLSTYPRTALLKPQHDRASIRQWIDKHWSRFWPPLTNHCSIGDVLIGSPLRSGEGGIQDTCTRPDWAETAFRCTSVVCQYGFRLWFEAIPFQRGQIQAMLTGLDSKELLCLERLSLGPAPMPCKWSRIVDEYYPNLLLQDSVQ